MSIQFKSLLRNKQHPTPDPNMEEMFEQFRVMLENIEKIPKNNFKRSAEIELTKMIQTTDWKKNDREWYLSDHPNFTDC